MIPDFMDTLGEWKRDIENYTVGFMIALVQLQRAKRQRRREALQAPGPG